MPSRASAFRRQVVFRIGAEDWPVLEAAAEREGSLQAGILAALRAFVPGVEPEPESQPSLQVASETGLQIDDSVLSRAEATPRRRRASSAARAETKPPEERIHAREAAALLDLKTGTVKGYIRSGRLPGHYEYGPEGGWFTTRAAVTRYRRSRR